MSGTPTAVSAAAAATDLLGDVDDAVLLEPRRLALAVAELGPPAAGTDGAIHANLNMAKKVEDHGDVRMVLQGGRAGAGSLTVFLVVWMRVVTLMRSPFSSVWQRSLASVRGSSRRECFRLLSGIGPRLSE